MSGVLGAFGSSVRGRVVAIVYVEAGGQRVDENALAGTGVPAPGRTKNSQPLPDFVVVDFPDYTGAAIF